MQSVWVGDHMVLSATTTCMTISARGSSSRIKSARSTAVIAEDNLMLRTQRAVRSDRMPRGQPSIVSAVRADRAHLTVSRNTIWTPGGGGASDAARSGWTGHAVLSEQRDQSPVVRYLSAVRFGLHRVEQRLAVRSGGHVAVHRLHHGRIAGVCEPAADDYRTNDGRGVTWRAGRPASTAPAPPPPRPRRPPPPADTTPPDTTITVRHREPPPRRARRSRSPRPSRARSQCKLDAGAYAACTSPKAYSGLSIGLAHVQRARHRRRRQR